MKLWGWFKGLFKKPWKFDPPVCTTQEDEELVEKFFEDAKDRQDVIPDGIMYSGEERYAGLRLSLSEMQPESGVQSEGTPQLTKTLQARDAKGRYSSKHRIQRRRVHKKHDRVRSD